ncbi:MAG: helix-turn-helix transcriptional regulator [Cyanobacteria bacterium P01_A01_bin.83]
MSKNYFWSKKIKTVTKLAVFCLSIAIAVTACGSQSLGDDNGSEAGDSFSQESNEPQNGARQPPDLDEAAEKLGVSEDELAEALGKSPPPDFEAAAEKLGVSVEELKDALPPPPEKRP